MISSGSRDRTGFIESEYPPDRRIVLSVRNSQPKAILDLFILPTSLTMRLVVLICKIAFRTKVAFSRISPPPKM